MPEETSILCLQLTGESWTTSSTSCAGDFALNACVLHPFDLSKVRLEAAAPDVHGGKGETSVMLALKPQLVRRYLIALAAKAPASEAIAALILDRGVSFPWRTDDARLAARGIIGDAQAATPELGRAIVDSVIAEAGDALRRLLANQRITPKTLRPPD